ncbi:UPF0389 protein FAM162A [Elysia marginata]|uniref:UPF0389 protein FAM162A n=1 Tax=Elysia marginata TaxID=1093978 RepID=A0AAV4EA07_9GAST|nr:UPF0389 protein FAM162A [Elysia marginata]
MMASIMLKSLSRANVVGSFTSNLRTLRTRLTSRCLTNSSRRQNPASNQLMSVRRYSDEISNTGIPSGHATQKPTPFQQKLLVWAKMYPSVDKVPDRVSRGQLKKAMDIFRVRTSICMAALVFVFAAMMAMIGRKQRQEGMTMTKVVLEKRQDH